LGSRFTRERLASKLRHSFRLRDDPLDISALRSIHAFTQEWMSQIENSLPNGQTLPREVELASLRKMLLAHHSFHFIGESGSGKSALAKTLATEKSLSGAEIVWVKTDQFPRLIASVADFIEVLQRTRLPTGLIVFDAMDACANDDVFKRIGQTITALSSNEASTWKVILVCQTPEWSRVSRHLAKTIAGTDALTKEVRCGDLSKDDMNLVIARSPSIRRLISHSHLSRMLASPKMLDLILRGQLSDNLNWASEADLVDWWWEEQVKSGKPFAAEEKIARDVAIRMANDLVTEVSPDVPAGPSESVESLLRNRVLRRTGDGRFRFDHDLLADWTRVMHLRSLGDDALSFMRANTENPPWLRAIRLLSQHLLERTPNLARWRSVVTRCKGEIKDGKEPPAEDLQVLDSWLEGIAYCANSSQVLKNVQIDLFDEDGWLLKRFAKRMLHTGTIPDPIIQQRFYQIDSTLAQEATIRFRLPQAVLWNPFLEFLIVNSDQSTDFIPVELAEIGAMWARLEEYIKLQWPALADLVLLNGEKELHREVSGEYRHDRGPQSIACGSKSRVRIYTSALLAASQFPDRSAKLLLKAAGRIPWEKGDVSDTADEGWNGEWHNRPFEQYDSYVKTPVESWPEGPTRRISKDFFRAWFDDTTALILFKLRPNAACEATLAFLIDWPRSEIIRGRHSFESDQHGFCSDADDMYPAFWSKGPFLNFLRQDWRAALGLVVRLVNFATDRYEDWWPYDPGVREVHISTPQGTFRWKGNHQVYAWNRFHMNTPQMITCALMAVEKWFDEQIEANNGISDAVNLLYQEGRSLAFAGVLVSIGKRHPDKFATDLKPLLFLRDIYMFDHKAVLDNLGDDYWSREGEYINKLRAEWAQLPGRKKQLKNACCEWLMTKPELEAVFAEISATWQQKANALPEGSGERLPLLRWAADFNRSLYKEVTLPDGRKGWQQERPIELRDEEGEQTLLLRQTLINLPYTCTELLEKRPKLPDDQLEAIWQKLQHWTIYEQVSATTAKVNDDSIGDSTANWNRNIRWTMISLSLLRPRL